MVGTNSPQQSHSQNPFSLATFQLKYGTASQTPIKKAYAPKPRAPRASWPKMGGGGVGMRGGCFCSSLILSFMLKALPTNRPPKNAGGGPTPAVIQSKT